MPKEHKHIAEAQKQRKKIKEKFSKYVPGRVTLQVLGTGARGAPKSLYVFSDQSRYLFNCGEGTQRLAHEHKMKLAKLEHIFVTQPVWRNIGGLPGIALTIQDVGVPQITLHGPQGLEEIFTATRRFIVIRDLEIKVPKCSSQDTFEDNVMVVKYVPLLRSSGGIFTQDADNASNPSETADSASVDTAFCKGVQAGTAVGLNDASTLTVGRKSRHRAYSRQNSPIKYEMEEFEDDDTDYYAHERKRRRKRNRRRSRSRSRSSSVSRDRAASSRISDISKQLLQETKEQGVSMSYICRLRPRPGALCLEKCVYYGVPPGPLLGKLKAGEDVILQNGTLVKSSDVCEPNDPGPVFIVVDCPSGEYLESLLENEEFKKHQRQASHEEDLAYLVVHFTPQNIMENPRYQWWMDQFPPCTFHLVLNESNNCMGSISVHRIQYKLNLLCEHIFPLLGDKGTEIDEVKCSKTDQSTKRMKVENGVNTIATGEKGSLTTVLSPDSLERLSMKSRPPSPVVSIINPSTFFNLHLRPRKGIDRTGELKLVPSFYIEECMMTEGFSDALLELKVQLLEERKKICVRPYPKVVFLGTGSCIPNKTRNTSGILLQISENVNILLDCGEGTYGQIVRFFGPDKVNEVLMNTKAVYISHLHADHHIGLIGFLQGRKMAFTKSCSRESSVLLLAPRQIMSWLSFYDKFFENIGTDFEIIPNHELLFGEHKLQDALEARVLNTLEMASIDTCYVRHCPNAFGVSFKDRNGYKITYSGDTMPSDNLIKIGMNSDLLIHEATMEDELANEAVIKMHSTTSQAIIVGKEMQARFILLTHFSQRYAKLPRFNENITNNVGIAFDNMQVRLDELPLLHLFYPALRKMFAEHYEELENKAVKRQLRIERQREASRDRSISPDEFRGISPKKVSTGT